ncbi:hypothetical protein JCM14244_11270 [Venenivibrio stagnispumantis]|uniref:Capsule assembly protein Wzi n=1 Tax=Venenivibrio stagnispumantis TaxID=407998 RepID=A0AA45WNC4_9AQUI|nr:capsule assembly Wzi family protein [Venenivibrio stagnispumantis]MCW4573190.1 capsule assembly Wzi family protein [Venenivibrio stagnispumantis]SMP17672.1 Capsule assembly protein Wzi [Venenivibrio stagnispumantis]
MKKYILPNLILFTAVFANPYLNINSDDIFIYDNIQASKESKENILSIRPLPYFYIFSGNERLKYFSNYIEKPENYIKPVNNIDISVFNTNADYLLLEGKSGLSLRKGLNVISTEDGQISYQDKFVGYYQFRQIINKDQKEGQVLRAYAKFLAGKFSIEIGKDNVNWGQGEYGLLLSNNAYPFPMVKVQTEEPLDFYGKWSFAILNGWLQEERKDVSYPKILGIRGIYKPASFFEVGLTKTTMYGGSGRPEYKSFKDYWKLITSSEDNVPGSRYDNDSYGSYDIALYLPLKWFDIFKIYYEEAGTDVQAVWQKEDRKLSGRFPFIFGLLSRSYNTGVFISKGKDIFRFEYVKTADNFYIHHYYYYEGYSYKGYSLGYPYGRDVHSLFFKYIHWIDNQNWIDFKMSVFKQPWKENVDIKSSNYYASLEYGKILNKNIQIKPFIRYDYKKGIDKNTLPTQFSIENKKENYLTVGLALNLRF